MSLTSWKAEFYPVPAEKVSKKNALTHSLTKWRGLMPEHIERHGLTVGVAEIYSPRGRLSIDADSCALCAHHWDSWDCNECPLFLSRGSVQCDKPIHGKEDCSPYRSWSEHSDPKPMIRALEKAIKFVAKKEAA